MKIVLDTNCLLLILSKKGSFYSIFEQIKLGNVQLIVTTEIINEYEEILEKIYSTEVAENVVKAILNHSKTILIDKIYYNWNLIFVDQDDNKFVDAYITGNASFLVTNDKHFEILKAIKFPPVSIINLIDFKNNL
jgi:uncharacterized protein